MPACGAISAAAAAISAAAAIGSTAYTMLSGSTKVNIPTPQTPAVAAPGARTDTGAYVTIGTSAEDIKSQRVSTGSRRTGTSSTSQGDVLGGLGRSGLSI